MPAWLWPSGDGDIETDAELEETRALVAVHEAGHAVACDVFGIPYSEIHVAVVRTYWTGQLHPSGHVLTDVTSRDDIEDDLEYAAMCLAGMEAEALYLMEVVGWRKGRARGFAEDHAGTDLRHAQEIVGRGGMYDAERKARRLVEARWRAIARLAVSL